MPTILTHAIVPLTMAWGLGRETIKPRLAAAGMITAILPDADIVSFALGIPYGNELGHRGASHSLAAVLLLALVAWVAAPALRSQRSIAFLFVGASAASHGLADMFTNGGLGVALWWPLSDARLFAPVRPIAVSPIGLRFFGPDGLAVLASELVWLLVPVGLLAALVRLRRRRNIDSANTQT